MLACHTDWNTPENVFFEYKILHSTTVRTTIYRKCLAKNIPNMYICNVVILAVTPIHKILLNVILHVIVNFKKRIAQYVLTPT
jgi:hypothetical protein